MVAAFLNFIFLLLLAVLFAGGLLVWRVFRQFRKAAEQLRKQSGFSSSETTSTYQNKEGVIDTRSEEEANKKIFAHDEGEYVEFTEE